MKLKKYFLTLGLIVFITSSAYCENTDDWLIGGKLGISSFTGMIGLELQKNSWSLNLGRLSFANTIGVKYYFSGLKSSWYVGPFYMQGTRDEYDELDQAIGLGGGHRWQYNNGINLGFGVSTFYWEENKNDDGIAFWPELYFGYSF
jgi:hypothetical protein